MVYLRDLNEELQRERIRIFEKANRKDLIKAIKAGKDIEIGEYWREKDIKIVE